MINPAPRNTQTKTWMDFDDAFIDPETNAPDMKRYVNLAGVLNQLLPKQAGVVMLICSWQQARKRRQKIKTWEKYPNITQKPTIDEAETECRRA